jgi:hypothetical protein
MTWRIQQQKPHCQQSFFYKGPEAPLLVGRPPLLNQSRMSLNKFIGAVKDTKGNPLFNLAQPSVLSFRAKNWWNKHKQKVQKTLQHEASPFVSLNECCSNCAGY